MINWKVRIKNKAFWLALIPAVLLVVQVFAALFGFELATDDLEVKLLDEPVKPFESLPWAKERRLDLAEYMREHIYMYSSENVRAKFRIVKPMISDVIDMFGMEVRFSDETDDTVTVTATVNEMSMLQFARSFAPDVVLLEPEELAKKVKDTAERTVEVYKDI